MADELADVTDAADKAAMWTVNRDTRIKTAREQGYTLREIAEAAQLSHTQVANICRHTRIA